MTTRRDFLGAIALPAAAGFVGSAPAALRPGAAAAMAALAHTPGAPDDVARDEDFWFEVSRAFTLDRSLVNLNNGGVSPSPAFVQEAMKRRLDFCNSTPPPTVVTRFVS